LISFTRPKKKKTATTNEEKHRTNMTNEKTKKNMPRG
jgi:hypothetical protein